MPDSCCTIAAEIADTVPAMGDSSCAQPTQLAVESVYADYNLFVWRTLRRLGVDETDAADALQDVFLVVHRRLGDFAQRASLKTWLFGIAMRVASDYIRRNPRRREQSVADLTLEASSPSPVERTAHSEAVELLYALLQQLPPDQRAAFILAELEQMSVSEIATALDASIHTVTSRLKAARCRFEQGLLRHRARDGWRNR